MHLHEFNQTNTSILIPNRILSSSSWVINILHIQLLRNDPHTQTIHFRRLIIIIEYWIHNERKNQSFGWFWWTCSEYLVEVMWNIDLNSNIWDFELEIISKFSIWDSTSKGNFKLIIQAIFRIHILYLIGIDVIIIIRNCFHFKVEEKVRNMKLNVELINYVLHNQNPFFVMNFFRKSMKC